jgi:hypothetical protein
MQDRALYNIIYYTILIFKCYEYMYYGFDCCCMLYTKTYTHTTCTYIYALQTQTTKQVFPLLCMYFSIATSIIIYSYCIIVYIINSGQ